MRYQKLGRISCPVKTKDKKMKMSDHRYRSRQVPAGRRTPEDELVLTLCRQRNRVVRWSTDVLLNRWWERNSRPGKRTSSLCLHIVAEQYILIAQVQFAVGNDRAVPRSTRFEQRIVWVPERPRSEYLEASLDAHVRSTCVIRRDTYSRRS